MEGLKVCDANLVVYLHPSKAKKVSQAVLRELSSLIFKFNETFDGVVLAYDVNILSDLAKILPGVHPYFGVRLKSKLLMFNPKPNMLIEGKVVKVGQQLIHAVVLGFSSAIIIEEDIREEFKYRVKHCGAAVHVCNNRSLYSTYEDCSGFVYMGDGSKLLVRGVGEVRLDLFDGSVQTIINVRHVPEIKWNLISLSRLESLGMWYSTRGGVMSVYHGDDVVLKASRCGSLYRLHERVVYDGARESRSIYSGGANAAMMSYGLGGGPRPLTTQSYVPVMMSSMDMV